MKGIKKFSALVLAFLIAVTSVNLSSIVSNASVSLPVKFEGFSAVLADKIGFDFYVTMTKAIQNIEDKHLEFKIGNETIQVSDYRTKRVGGKDMFVYECPVAAAQMTAQVTATFIANGLSYGTITNSVENYARTVIADQSLEVAYEAVAAMLNYGTYAQKYFKYNTGDLANKSLGYTSKTDPVLNFNNIISSEYDKKQVGTSSLCTYYGGSLVCEGSTFVRLYFDLKKSMTVDEINKTFDISVTNNGEALELGGENCGLSYNADIIGNRLAVTIYDIPAEELDTMFDITITNKSSSSDALKVSYGAYSYISKVLSSSDSSTELKNLAKAMYLYSQAAEEYFSNVLPISGSLTVWAFTQDAELYAERFMEKYPDVDVEVKMIATADYVNMVERNFSDEVTPYDVILAEPQMIGEMTEIGMFENIDQEPYNFEQYEDMFYDYINEVSKVDGVHYLVGAQSTPSAIYYRRSIANRVFGTDDPEMISKLFASYETILGTAEQLKKKGVKLFASDSELGYLAPSEAWVENDTLKISKNQLDYLHLYNSLYNGEYTTFSATWSAPWYKAMNEPVDVLSADVMWGDWGTDEEGNTNLNIWDADNYEANVYKYSRGKADVFAYCLPAWGVSTLRNNADRTCGDWAVCEGPTNNFGGGTYYGISSKSANKNLAWEYIKFATMDEEMVEEYLDGYPGDCSSNKVVMAKHLNDTIELTGNQKVVQLWDQLSRKIDYSVVSPYDGAIANEWSKVISSYKTNEKSEYKAINDFYKAVESLYPNLTIDKSVLKDLDDGYDDYEPAITPSGKLKIWTFTEDTRFLAESFIERFPDVSYEITKISTSDYLEALEAQNNGETVPFDVLIAEPNMLTEMVDEGLLENLDSETYGYADYQDNFYDYINNISYVYDGHYAMGFQASPCGIFYRRSIAEEVLGTDNPNVIGDYLSTYDSLLNIAEILNDSGYKLFASDEALCYYNENSTWVNGNTVRISYDKLKLMDTINTLYNNRLTSFVASWSVPWYKSMNGPTEVLNPDIMWGSAEKDEAGNPLLNIWDADNYEKNVHIYTDATAEIFAYGLPAWGSLTISNIADKTVGDWAICQGPISSFGNGNFYGVAAKSTNKALAWEFIKYITLDKELCEKYLEYNQYDFLANKKLMSFYLDDSIPFFGGQKIYHVWDNICRSIDSSNYSGIDTDISYQWEYAINSYKEGKQTKDEAILDFYKSVEAIYPDIYVDRSGYEVYDESEGEGGDYPEYNSDGGTYFNRDYDYLYWMNLDQESYNFIVTVLPDYDYDLEYNLDYFYSDNELYSRAESGLTYTIDGVEMVVCSSNNSKYITKLGNNVYKINYRDLIDEYFDSVEGNYSFILYALNSDLNIRNQSASYAYY